MNTNPADLDKIKDKLAKLIRLQEGAIKIGSLEEAGNASAKIQTLLMKYNLSMADISSKENHKLDIEHNLVSLSDLGRSKTSGKWMESLCSVLCNNNLCKPVLSGDNIYIFGGEENVKIVSVLFTQLVHRLKIMARDSFKAYTGFEKKNTFYRGYLMGAVRGINTKLIENKRELEAKEIGMTALIVMTDKLVAQAVENHFGSLRKGRSSKVSGQDGATRGFRDGKNMSINKSITS